MFPDVNSEYTVQMFARELASLIVERWRYHQQVRLERARATGEFYEI